MKHYFLGLAANYSRQQRTTHTFAIGRKRDCDDLRKFLEKKYVGEAILTKNGRSALALALKAYFKPGDGIIVNGFTCYAVYEAVKAAGLVPVFVDINKDSLNFDDSILNNLDMDSSGSRIQIRGIIVQNTFGIPVDIVKIEKFAKKHSLVIIEDLAHCVGVKYTDGREAGTVGAATALSFGKEKSIDTISGGAVVLRKQVEATKGAPVTFPKIKKPNLSPKVSDVLRARFYPLFGAISRGLSYIHLSGPWMRLLLKIHWVEKSADNKLDLDRKISKFEAKLALIQLKALKKTGEERIRDFYFVKNRNETLKKLRKAGYYFDSIWYEKPVSPSRYYKKVHFPEDRCPNAVFVAEHIVNLPVYYNKAALKPARRIIEEDKYGK